MRNFTKIARNWGGVLLLSTAVFVSCSKEDEGTPETPASEFPALNEIIGAWEADGYRWDLDNGKNYCYLMNGNDYAYDENDNYIYMTARAFCEQYAQDYNADPNNTIKGTAEDFADFNHANNPEDIAFTNINITKERLTLYRGLRGNLASCWVDGTYTYDQQTGVITVEDASIDENNPEIVKIDVWKSEDGYLNFRYREMDMFGVRTYDQINRYTYIGAMVFYCIPGTPYVE